MPPARPARRRGALTRGQFAELVFIQLATALAIGWLVLLTLWGALVLLGRTAPSAAMWALLIEGVFLLAVGLFSIGTPGYAGPTSTTRWLSDRWGTPGTRSAEGRGLTLTAQCLIVALPMLLIAGLFGK